MPGYQRDLDLPLRLSRGSEVRTATAVAARPHTLLVAFDGGSGAPSSPQEFETASLIIDDTPHLLGSARFEPHPHHEFRRADDPSTLTGDGLLVFTERVHDFRQVQNTGRITTVLGHLQQLPMLLRRRDEIDPEFLRVSTEIYYDLQAYRSMTDELDENLLDEPSAVRDQIRNLAVIAAWPHFQSFFDERLERLEEAVRGFGRNEHERHGFFFRKLFWDLILSAPFMARCSQKPRGYAGDSEMMRMIYAEGFEGDSVFACLLHHHPLQHPGAEAVRNRRTLISEAVEAAHAKLSANPFRVLSVACGPAAELEDIFVQPEDAARYEFVLIDQDPVALAQARSQVARIEARLGQAPRILEIQDSVRTMLREPDPIGRWGRFHFIYSMGLFDYLAQPVARAVLTRLYTMLEPGGKLVIGNFHVENRSRIYMEYWHDWALVHRNQDDMLDLTRDLEGAAFEVGFEPTRTQMFLAITRS